MLEKHLINSPIHGVQLLILGAIHGNETAGTIACRRLLDELDNGLLQLLKGSLTIMPLCNPLAFEKKCRFIEENLNRVINIYEHPATYEQELANEIAPQIANADVILDLHSTHCPNDKPFAFLDYPDAIAQQIITNLPIDYVLEGWPEIYALAEEINDYSTLRYAHDHGATGTTIECGYHFAHQAAEVAYQAIINTLQSLGMITGFSTPNKNQKNIVMKSYIIKEKAGRLSQNYSHLDAITQGETIAIYDDGEKLTASEDCYILIPNHEATIGTEWFYLGIDKN